MVRAYIVADLEGAAGVIHSSQVQPGSPFYEEARRLLTEGLTRPLQAPCGAGATEVVVNDGHGGAG
jgi:D-amino peptidase